MLDHLIPHKLLEFDLPDLGSRDALDPFKVRGPVDQGMQIEIWWNRVELGLRVCCYARHLEAGGRACAGEASRKRTPAEVHDLEGLKGGCDCATRWYVKTSQRMFGAPFLSL